MTGATMQGRINPGHAFRQVDQPMTHLCQGVVTDKAVQHTAPPTVLGVSPKPDWEPGPV